MIDQIRLTAQEIVEKDFKKSMRGYNEEEVDAFLDIIIQDYENFTKEIDKLKQEVERLKRAGTTTQSRQTSTPQPQVSQVNYDVLKRLSNLEKAVFGQRAVENE